jgi:iron complex outermembrane recepter protein
VNLFGNYNYAYRENLNHLIINRNFFENGVFKGSDDKDNYAHMPVNSHSLRLGADFFPSKNTIIGFVVNTNYSRFRRNAEITTTVNDLQYQPDFKFISTGTNNDKNGNAVANINFKHKFDSTGKELTADLDYGTFQSNSLTRTASRFFNLDGTKKREDDILDGDQIGDLQLKTAKIDYSNPLKKGAKFEAGFKSSLVSSDNDAKFFNVLPSGPVVDNGKTNRFFYKEYNNAGYLNFSKEAKKYSVQLGLRGEHTNVNTRQARTGETFHTNYFQLFPSAFFNYKLKEDKTLGVSVSRRIDRPGYSQLKNLNFTLGYSHTTDPQNVVLSPILAVIPNFPIAPDQDSNITVQIPVNLESSDYFGLTATTPIRISKWWNMINNLNVYYNEVKGSLNGAAPFAGAIIGNIRTNNTFTFKKGWTAELNANFNTGGRSGYSDSKVQWALSTGVQKNIMEGKGTVRFNFTDIFWTNRPRSTITYKGRYIENWQAYRESRVANLTFTYRFGNNKVQQARRRTTASEEEIRRAGGN